MSHSLGASALSISTASARPDDASALENSADEPGPVLPPPSDAAAPASAFMCSSKMHSTSVAIPAGSDIPTALRAPTPHTGPNTCACTRTSFEWDWWTRSASSRLAGPSERQSAFTEHPYLCHHFRVAVHDGRMSAEIICAVDHAKALHESLDPVEASQRGADSCENRECIVSSCKLGPGDVVVACRHTGDAFAFRVVWNVSRHVKEVAVLHSRHV